MVCVALEDRFRTTGQESSSGGETSSSELSKVGKAALEVSLSSLEVCEAA